MKRWMSVLFALCVGAAACGDSGTVEAGTEAAPAEDSGPQSYEDLEFESPIADFLGVDTNFDFSSDDSQAEFAEQSRKAEETVALCMREQGFEYTPVDQTQFMSFEQANDELPWGSRAWSEKYGFGITTQRFSQSEVGPDLVGWDDTEMEAMEDFVDPNQDYVSSLPEAEQEAYYEALYGNQPDLAEDATDEEWQEAYENWEPDGCEAEAWSEGGIFGGPEQNFYEEFGDELDELYERVEADPKIADHRAEVSACVAERGHDYSGDMQDLYEYFEEKMSGIGPDYSQDPLAEAGLDPEAMSDEELDAFYEQAFSVELSEADKATLGELQQEEIELAVAVWDCNGSDLQMAELFNEVLVSYEEQFLVDNADRLGEFEGSAEG